MRRALNTIIIGAACCICASVSKGDLVTALTTLNNSQAGTVGFSQFISLGIGFSTGNIEDGSDWSISVALGGYPSAGGHMDLWWADNDGAPGGEILSTPLPNSGSSVFTLTRDGTDTGSGAYDLNPDFKYMLIFRSDSSGGALSMTGNPADTTDPAASANWSAADHYYQRIGAGSWGKVGALSSRMSVSVVSVPEPATVSLIGIAGISMISVHRIRRREKNAVGEE